MANGKYCEYQTPVNDGTRTIAGPERRRLDRRLLGLPNDGRVNE